jgi:hypothetical protein
MKVCLAPAFLLHGGLAVCWFVLSVKRKERERGRGEREREE